MSDRAIVDAMLNRVRRHAAPPPHLSIADWAERFMYLPNEAAAEPGKMRLSRFPWQREMLDSVLDPTVGENVWLMGKQLGKSQCLLCVMGYHIHHAPCPQIYKLPSAVSAERNSRERITPTIEATPVLRAVIKEAKGRSSENTVALKKYPGGFIALIGANSTAELRRRPAKVILQDEIDDDEISAGEQGDPVALADGRAETFSGAVFIKASTPTIKGSSRITTLFEQTDQRHWFCPCPKCGQHQWLKWEQVKWITDGDISAAWYECEHCHAALSDTDRIAMIYRGEWRATAPFKGKRGYFLNGLNRIIGLKRHHKTYLHEFVDIYLEAIKSEETRKVWVNTFLAQAYEVKLERVDTKPLADRAEKYTPQSLPQRVLYLVAGTDVQSDRIEATLIGAGENDELWTVEHRIFPGDPSQPAVWDALEEWAQLPRQREDGVELLVNAVGLDTGHASKTVYTFIRKHRVKGPQYFAMKGRGGAGLPPVYWPKKSRVRSVKLFTVGTDTLKTVIYSNLAVKDPGKNFIHFASGHGQDAAYFDGLTAETVVTKWVAGKQVRVFENPAKKRNEPLDCYVYALAALDIKRPSFSALAKRLTPTPKDDGKEPVKLEYVRSEQPAPEPVPEVKPAAPAQPVNPLMNRPGIRVRPRRQW